MSLPHPRTAREKELRRRFAVRAEVFTHGGLRLRLLLPRAADELIDEAAFEHDERLPYWADLWPSARALARRLLDAPLPDGRALELGCGVGLPSLALLSRGYPDVLATDYYGDALDFARANAERNRLPPLATALLDWRDPPPALGRFALVYAADVLYEARYAGILPALLPRLLAPDGAVLLTDPGRAYLAPFRERMRALGWRLNERRLREPHAAAPRGAVEIHLLHLRPPPDTG